MLRKLLFLSVLTLGLCAFVSSCSDDAPSPTGPTTPTDTPPETGGLSIGPVPGLTTAWHAAPAKFSVTKDVKVVQFKFVATDERTIKWKGAVELSSAGSVSIAEAPVPPPGERQVVEVLAMRPARDGTGGTVTSYSCGFGVVDYSSDQVSVDQVLVSDGEPALDAYDTPESRMHLLLSGRSIALVKNTGKDIYRTAAGTIIHVKAPSAPSGVLMEWRLDGTPVLVGAEGDLTLSQVSGRHFVAVGPPQKPHRIRVDTYQTKIVVEGNDHIAPGGRTRFRVTTNPPGFEQDVRWMAGTMFGAAEPAVGQGATFEAVFDRTWPTNAGGITCYGVRAGNAALIVEQPPPFEGDMIRLRDDLGSLGDAMGSHACCISDSLARQNYYDALDELVKAKSKMSILVTTFDGLPKLVRLAIQVGYGDLHAQMASDLAQLEAAIAQLNAEPPCGSDALITGFAQPATFCSSLCAIAAIMAALGALLLVVGAVITAVAPEAVIGEILLIVGGILLGVGIIILSIVGPTGFNCC